MPSDKKPQGKYKPDENNWAYKPDNRGKYVHVPVPYDGKNDHKFFLRKFDTKYFMTGGYGPFMNPYDHLENPYNHIDK